MKKNSGSKDLLIISLLTFIILLIILAMYQRDREWTKLTAMERSLSEQSRDMSSLRSSLNTMQKRLESVSLASTVNNQNSTANTTKSAKSDVSLAFKRAKLASEQPDYAQGDWSVNALGSGLKTITPLVSTDADASDIQSYILEPLMTRDPDTLKWTGLIAEDWTISEDGLVITFRLRDDVYFSDGEPLDSSDVVFTFDFIMNEKIQAPRHRAYLEKIAKVEANGPYSVTFTYKEPYFEALELAGTLEVFPEHFYKEYLEDPTKFNESKGILMGSGPYQLKDPKGWSPDQVNIELVRNPRYWGDVQPSYDRILWRVIQNASARLTTYRNGDIDTYGARPIEYEKLKKDSQIMEKSHNFEYMNPVASYSYLGWNQEKEGKPTIFADKRIRQAMTYLIDRDRVNKDIYLGYAETAISPFSPTSKQHDPNLKPREYSIDKAKALLKEAGYEDRDGNGVLENDKGEPFEFNLTYFQGNEDTNRMVLLLKDLFAKAGVKLIPSPQEWPVMLEMLTKKNFESITLAWTSGIETDIFQMFHGSQAKTNGDNFINYKNAELDKLIDQARSTVDPEKRMPLWQKAEAIMYEDQPYTFLFRRQTLAFIDKRISNLKLTKLGLNRGRLPMEQYVPKPLQKYSQ
jgi:peptide/nickel transport system substrate-binding protein